MEEQTISVTIDRVGLIAQPCFHIGQLVIVDGERQTVIGVCLSLSDLTWDYTTLNREGDENTYPELEVAVIE